jgi:hypothetical protein
MVSPSVWAVTQLFLLALAPQALETAATTNEDPRPQAALGACAAADVRKGIEILAQLYTETRAPAFVFNQGRCYQQNGQLEAARQRFAEYLRIGRSEPAADIRRAQQLVKEVDDALARQKADALAAGAGESPLRASRIAAAALTVLGLAAVGTGVYMGMKVQSTQNSIESQFSGSDSYVTDAGTLKHQVADGTRYETWQWVSYGVGVAALAGAVTTFALGGRSAPAPRAPGGPEAAPAPAPPPTSVVLVPAISPGGAGGVLRVSF